MRGKDDQGEINDRRPTLKNMVLTWTQTGRESKKKKRYLPMPYGVVEFRSGGGNVAFWRRTLRVESVLYKAAGGPPDENGG